MDGKRRRPAWRGGAGTWKELTRATYLPCGVEILVQSKWKTKTKTKTPSFQLLHSTSSFPSAITIAAH
jgi:hypothetical protein